MISSSNIDNQQAAIPRHLHLLAIKPLSEDQLRVLEAWLNQNSSVEVTVWSDQNRLLGDVLRQAIDRRFSGRSPTDAYEHALDHASFQIIKAQIQMLDAFHQGEFDWFFEPEQEVAGRAHSSFTQGFYPEFKQQFRRYDAIRTQLVNRLSTAGQRPRIHARELSGAWLDSMPLAKYYARELLLGNLVGAESLAMYQILHRYGGVVFHSDALEGFSGTLPDFNTLTDYSLPVLVAHSGQQLDIRLMAAASGNDVIQQTMDNILGRYQFLEASGSVLDIHSQDAREIEVKALNQLSQMELPGYLFPLIHYRRWQLTGGHSWNQYLSGQFPLQESLDQAISHYPDKAWIQLAPLSAPQEDIAATSAVEYRSAFDQFLRRTVWQAREVPIYEKKLNVGRFKIDLLLDAWDSPDNRRMSPDDVNRLTAAVESAFGLADQFSWLPSDFYTQFSVLLSQNSAITGEVYFTGDKGVIELGRDWLTGNFDEEPQTSGDRIAILNQLALAIYEVTNPQSFWQRLTEAGAADTPESIAEESIENIVANRSLVVDKLSLLMQGKVLSGKEIEDLYSILEPREDLHQPLRKHPYAAAELEKSDLIRQLLHEQFLERELNQRVQEMDVSEKQATRFHLQLWKDGNAYYKKLIIDESPEPSSDKKGRRRTRRAIHDIKPPRTPSRRKSSTPSLQDWSRGLLEGEEAVRASGIPSRVVAAWQQVAIKEGAFFGFRPVNPDSAYLLEHGLGENVELGTKKLTVHGKSSDWGLQAGLIPFEAALSKVFGARGEENQNKIDHGNRNNVHSLESTENHAVPLRMSLETARHWQAEGRIHGLRQSSDDDSVYLAETTRRVNMAHGSEAPVETDVRFEYRLTRTDGGLYSVEFRSGDYHRLRGRFADFQPLNVMAQSEGDNGSTKVLVADVDMYCLFKRMDAYDIRALRSTGSVDETTPDIDVSNNRIPSRFRDTVSVVRDMLGQADRRRFSDEGRLTNFQRYIISELNEAARQEGSIQLIQHGTEQDNTEFPERDDRILFIDDEGKIYQTNTFDQVARVIKYNEMIKGVLTYINRSYNRIAGDGARYPNQGQVVGSGAKVVFQTRFSLDELQLISSQQTADTLRRLNDSTGYTSNAAETDPHLFKSEPPKSDVPSIESLSPEIIDRVREGGAIAADELEQLRAAVLRSELTTIHFSGLREPVRLIRDNLALVPPVRWRKNQLIVAENSPLDFKTSLGMRLLSQPEDAEIRVQLLQSVAFPFLEVAIQLRKDDYRLLWHQGQLHSTIQQDIDALHREFQSGAVHKRIAEAASLLAGQTIAGSAGRLEIELMPEWQTKESIINLSRDASQEVQTCHVQLGTRHGATGQFEGGFGQALSTLFGIALSRSLTAVEQIEQATQVRRVWNLDSELDHSNRMVLDSYFQPHTIDRDRQMHWEAGSSEGSISSIRPLTDTQALSLHDGTFVLDHPVVTRPTEVEGASSNWGIQAGLIPLEAELSRFTGDRKRVRASVKANREALNKAHYQAITLTVSSNNIFRHLTQGSIADFQVDADDYLISTASRTINGETVQFQYRFVPVGDNNFRVEYKSEDYGKIHRRFREYRPLEVLAETGSGSALVAPQHDGELLSRQFHKLASNMVYPFDTSARQSFNRDIKPLFPQLNQIFSESSAQAYLMAEELKSALVGFRSRFPRYDSSLQAMRRLIDARLNDFVHRVPPALHFIWIGQVGETQINYMRVWAQVNPDKPVNLWYDPKAFLSYHLNSSIKKFVQARLLGTVPLSDYRFSLRLMEEVIGMQDQAFNQIKATLRQGGTFDQGAARFLREVLGQSARDIEVTRQKGLASYLQWKTTLTQVSNRQGNSPAIELRDINSLWDNAQESSFRDYYHQEMALRGNLAAASDLVRYEVLNQKGGYYLDADLFPRLNERLYSSIDESPYTSTGDKWALQSVKGRIIERVLFSDASGQAQKNQPSLLTNDKNAFHQFKTLEMFEEANPELVSAIEQCVINRGNQPLFEPLANIKPAVGFGYSDSGLGDWIPNAALVSAPGNKHIQQLQKTILSRYRILEEHRLFDLNDSETMLSKAHDLNDIDPGYADLAYYRAEGIPTTGKIILASTLSLSGPGVLTRTMLDILDSDGEDLITEIDNLRQVFQIEPFANFATEEAIKSTWLSNQPARPNIYASDSRYSKQIILQLDRSESVATATRYLFNKHSDNKFFSRMVPLDTNGQLPRMSKFNLDENSRVIVVGQGQLTDNSYQVSGKSAGELASLINQLTDGVRVKTTSIVASGTTDGDSVEHFSRDLFSQTDTQNLNVRSALILVDVYGRKWAGTLQADGLVQWDRQGRHDKWVISRNEQGDITVNKPDLFQGESGRTVAVRHSEALGAQDLGNNAVRYITETIQISAPVSHQRVNGPETLYQQLSQYATHDYRIKEGSQEDFNELIRWYCFDSDNQRNFLNRMLSELPQSILEQQGTPLVRALTEIYGDVSPHHKASFLSAFDIKLLDRLSRLPLSFFLTAAVSDMADSIRQIKVEQGSLTLALGASPSGDLYELRTAVRDQNEVSAPIQTLRRVSDNRSTAIDVWSPEERLESQLVLYKPNDGSPATYGIPLDSFNEAGEKQPAARMVMIDHPKERMVIRIKPDFSYLDDIRTFYYARHDGSYYQIISKDYNIFYGIEFTPQRLPGIQTDTLMNAHSHFQWLERHQPDAPILPLPGISNKKTFKSIERSGRTYLFQVIEDTDQAIEISDKDKLLDVVRTDGIIRPLARNAEGQFGLPLVDESGNRDGVLVIPDNGDLDEYVKMSLATDRSVHSVQMSYLDDQRQVLFLHNNLEGEYRNKFDAIKQQVSNILGENTRSKLGKKFRRAALQAAPLTLGGLVGDLGEASKNPWLADLKMVIDLRSKESSPDIRYFNQRAASGLDQRFFGSVSLLRLNMDIPYNKGMLNSLATENGRFNYDNYMDKMALFIGSAAKAATGESRQQVSYEELGFQSIESQLPVHDKNRFISDDQPERIGFDIEYQGFLIRENGEVLARANAPLASTKMGYPLLNVMAVGTEEGRIIEVRSGLLTVKRQASGELSNVWSLLEKSLNEIKVNTEISLSDWTNQFNTYLDASDIPGAENYKLRLNTEDFNTNDITIKRFKGAGIEEVSRASTPISGSPKVRLDNIRRAQSNISIDYEALGNPLSLIHTYIKSEKQSGLFQRSQHQAQVIAAGISEQPSAKLKSFLTQINFLLAMTADKNVADPSKLSKADFNLLIRTPAFEALLSILDTKDIADLNSWLGRSNEDVVYKGFDDAVFRISGKTINPDRFKPFYDYLFKDTLSLRNHYGRLTVPATPDATGFIVDADSNTVFDFSMEACTQRVPITKQVRERTYIEEGLRYLDDGTKYISDADLDVLGQQEHPFNKERMREELVNGRIEGNRVLAKSHLSNAETEAIKWYTSIGFQYINRSLRNNKKLNTFQQDKAIGLIKGMSKLETFHGTVYRAFMPDISLTELDSRIVPGQLIGLKGFCSTSTSAEFVKDFRGGKGTVVLTILEAKGTNIAGLAQLEQAEILLKPGSHIRIKAAKKTDKHLHIVAEYTEVFQVGERVSSLFDGSKLGIAINSDTTTLHKEAQASFDSADINRLLKPETRSPSGTGANTDNDLSDGDKYFVVARDRANGADKVRAIISTAWRKEASRRKEGDRVLDQTYDLSFLKTVQDSDFLGNSSEGTRFLLENLAKLSTIDDPSHKQFILDSLPERIQSLSPVSQQQLSDDLIAILKQNGDQLKGNDYAQKIAGTLIASGWQESYDNFKNDAFENRVLNHRLIVLSEIYAASDEFTVVGKNRNPIKVDFRKGLSFSESREEERFSLNQARGSETYWVVGVRDPLAFKSEREGIYRVNKRPGDDEGLLRISLRPGQKNKPLKTLLELNQRHYRSSYFDGYSTSMQLQKDLDAVAGYFSDPDTVEKVASVRKRLRFDVFGASSGRSVVIQLKPVGLSQSRVVVSDTPDKPVIVELGMHNDAGVPKEHSRSRFIVQILDELYPRALAASYSSQSSLKNAVMRTWGVASSDLPEPGQVSELQYFSNLHRKNGLSIGAFKEGLNHSESVNSPELARGLISLLDVVALFDNTENGNKDKKNIKTTLLNYLGSLPEAGRSTLAAELYRHYIGNTSFMDFSVRSLYEDCALGLLRPMIGRLLEHPEQYTPAQIRQFDELITIAGESRLTVRVETRRGMEELTIKLDPSLAMNGSWLNRNTREIVLGTGATQGLSAHLIKGLTNEFAQPDSQLGNTALIAPGWIASMMERGSPDQLYPAAMGRPPELIQDSTGRMTYELSFTSDNKYSAIHLASTRHFASEFDAKLGLNFVPATTYDRETNRLFSVYMPDVMKGAALSVAERSNSPYIVLDYLLGNPIKGKQSARFAVNGHIYTTGFEKALKSVTDEGVYKAYDITGEALSAFFYNEQRWNTFINTDWEAFFDQHLGGRLFGNDLWMKSGFLVRIEAVQEKFAGYLPSDTDQYQGFFSQAAKKRQLYLEQQKMALGLSDAVPLELSSTLMRLDAAKLDIDSRVDSIEQGLELTEIVQRSTVDPDAMQSLADAVNLLRSFSNEIDVSQSDRATTSAFEETNFSREKVDKVLRQADNIDLPEASNKAEISRWKEESRNQRGSNTEGRRLRLLGRLLESFDGKIGRLRESYAREGVAIKAQAKAMKAFINADFSSVVPDNIANSKTAQLKIIMELIEGLPKYASKSDHAPSFDDIVDKTLTLFEQKGYGEYLEEIRPQLLDNPDFKTIITHSLEGNHRLAEIGSMFDAARKSPVDAFILEKFKLHSSHRFHQLDKLQRTFTSKKLGKGYSGLKSLNMGFGAVNAFVSLDEMQNHPEMYAGMSSDAVNTMKASAYLGIAGVSYGLASQAINPGTKLINRITGKSIKMGSKAARAVPLVGNLIAISAGILSLKNSVEQVQNTKARGTRYNILVANIVIDSISLALDCVSAVLDATVLLAPVGFIIDAINMLLGFAQMIMNYLMPPPTAQEDFDILINSDAFKEMVQKIADEAEADGYSELRYQTNGYQLLKDKFRKYDQELRELSYKEIRKLSGLLGVYLSDEDDMGEITHTGTDRNDYFRVTGDDTVYTKDGEDAVYFSSMFAGKAFLGAGDDFVFGGKEQHGGRGEDTLIHGIGAARQWGGEDRDFIVSGTGRIYVDGGDGEAPDTYSIPSTHGQCFGPEHPEAEKRLYGTGTRANSGGWLPSQYATLKDVSISCTYHYLEPREKVCYQYNVNRQDSSYVFTINLRDNRVDNQLVHVLQQGQPLLTRQALSSNSTVQSGVRDFRRYGYWLSEDREFRRALSESRGGRPAYFVVNAANAHGLNIKDNSHYDCKDGTVSNPHSGVNGLWWLNTQASKPYIDYASTPEAFLTASHELLASCEGKTFYERSTLACPDDADVVPYARMTQYDNLERAINSLQKPAWSVMHAKVAILSRTFTRLMRLGAYPNAVTNEYSHCYAVTIDKHLHHSFFKGDIGRHPFGPAGGLVVAWSPWSDQAKYNPHYQVLGVDCIARDNIYEGQLYIHVNQASEAENDVQLYFVSNDGLVFEYSYEVLKSHFGKNKVADAFLGMLDTFITGGVIRGIENLVLTNEKTKIIANDRSNLISNVAAGSYVETLGGDDRVLVNAQEGEFVYIDTGTGNDFVSFFAGTHPVTLNLSNREQSSGHVLMNVEQIKGTAFADVVSLGDGNTSYDTGGGNDTISMGQGNNILTLRGGDTRTEAGGGKKTIVIKQEQPGHHVINGTHTESLIIRLDFREHVGIIGLYDLSIQASGSSGKKDTLMIGNNYRFNVPFHCDGKPPINGAWPCIPASSMTVTPGSVTLHLTQYAGHTANDGFVHVNCQGRAASSARIPLDCPVVFSFTLNKVQKRHEITHLSGCSHTLSFEDLQISASQQFDAINALLATAALNTDLSERCRLSFTRTTDDSPFLVASGSVDLRQLKHNVRGMTLGKEGLESIDLIIGSALADTLYGTEGVDNTILTMGGTDSVYGRSGKNTYVAGLGSSKIYGGPGIDILSYASQLQSMDEYPFFRTFRPTSIRFVMRSDIKGRGKVEHIWTDGTTEKRFKDRFTGIEVITGSEAYNVYQGAKFTDTFVYRGSSIVFLRGGNDQLIFSHYAAIPGRHSGINAGEGIDSFNIDLKGQPWHVASIDLPRQRLVLAANNGTDPSTAEIPLRGFEIFNGIMGAFIGDESNSSVTPVVVDTFYGQGSAGDDSFYPVVDLSSDNDISVITDGGSGNNLLSFQNVKYSGEAERDRKGLTIHQGVSTGKTEPLLPEAFRLDASHIAFPPSPTPCQETDSDFVALLRAGRLSQAPCSQGYAIARDSDVAFKSQFFNAGAIIGTLYPDLIVIREAKATVMGGDGGDILIDLAGGAVISGENGADYLFAMGNSGSRMIGGAGFDVHQGSAHDDNMTADQDADIMLGNYGRDTYIIDEKASGSYISDPDQASSIYLKGAGLTLDDIRLELTPDFTALDFIKKSRFVRFDLGFVPKVIRDDGSLVTGHFIDNLETYLSRIVVIDSSQSETDPAREETPQSSVLTGSDLKAFFRKALDNDERLDNVIKGESGALNANLGNDVLVVNGTNTTGSFELSGNNKNNRFVITHASADIYPGAGDNSISIDGASGIRIRKSETPSDYLKLIFTEFNAFDALSVNKWEYIPFSDQFLVTLHGEPEITSINGQNNNRVSLADVSQSLEVSISFSSDQGFVSLSVMPTSPCSLAQHIMSVTDLDSRHVIELDCIEGNRLRVTIRGGSSRENEANVVQSFFRPGVKTGVGIVLSSNQLSVFRDGQSVLTMASLWSEQWQAGRIILGNNQESWAQYEARYEHQQAAFLTKLEHNRDMYERYPQSCYGLDIGLPKWCHKTCRSESPMALCRLDKPDRPVYNPLEFTDLVIAEAAPSDTGIALIGQESFFPLIEFSVTSHRYPLFADHWPDTIELGQYYVIHGKSFIQSQLVGSTFHQVMQDPDHTIMKDSEGKSYLFEEGSGKQELSVDAPFMLIINAEQENQVLFRRKGEDLIIYLYGAGQHFNIFPLSEVSNQLTIKQYFPAGLKRLQTGLIKLGERLLARDDVRVRAEAFPEGALVGMSSDSGSDSYTTMDQLSPCLVTAEACRQTIKSLAIDHWHTNIDPSDENKVEIDLSKNLECQQDNEHELDWMISGIDNLKWGAYVPVIIKGNERSNTIEITSDNETTIEASSGGDTILHKSQGVLNYTDTDVQNHDATVIHRFSTAELNIDLGDEIPCGEIYASGEEDHFVLDIPPAPAASRRLRKQLIIKKSQPESGLLSGNNEGIKDTTTPLSGLSVSCANHVVQQDGLALLLQGINTFKTSAIGFSSPPAYPGGHQNPAINMTYTGG